MARIAVRVGADKVAVSREQVEDKAVPQAHRAQAANRLAVLDVVVCHHRHSIVPVVAVVDERHSEQRSRHRRHQALA